MGVNVHRRPLGAAYLPVTSALADIGTKQVASSVTPPTLNTHGLPPSPMNEATLHLGKNIQPEKNTFYLVAVRLRIALRTEYRTLCHLLGLNTALTF